MHNALLIMRTPLQLHLAQQVLSKEGIIEFDLIYLTQQNSEEDRFYFSKFGQGPGLRLYIEARPKRFDILNHLSFRYLLRDYFRNFKRKYVIAGSIDAPVISALIRRQTGATLITVDDGTANINKSSTYHDASRSWRYRIYAFLLGAKSLLKVRDQIKHHYTIFPGLENIVEDKRLRPLSLDILDDNSGDQEGSVTYFIGQPVLSEQRHAMEGAINKVLGNRKIDLYVRHPREDIPLDLGAPFLDKQGLIAEEAILLDAKGRKVHLVSGFSTATINLAPAVQSATIVIPFGGKMDEAREKERVARLCGCVVHRM